jgi:hypothetical protein
MIDKTKNKSSEEQQELNQKKFNIFDFFNSNKKIFIVVGVLILVLTILLPVTNNLKQDSVSSKNGLSIKLLGKSTVTVATKAEFLDPGYMAIDKKDGDLTNQVQILGIVDFNTPGTYERYYVVENSRGTIVEIKRTIIIKEGKEEDITLNLTLKGSIEMELEKGTTYIEPGYVASDATGKDLTKEVKVSSNLNNNVLGTYKITYSLISDGITKSATRIIKVVDKKVDDTDVNINTDITVNNSNPTSGSVRITLKITGTGYDYTVLPTGYKSYNTTINYTVSNNGTYVFNVYDKNGGVKTAEKTITNIDNEEPVAYCTGEIKNDNKTYLIVEASDDSGSLSYVYKSGSITSSKLSSNTYVINSRTKTATVTVSDKVGNSITSVCSISGDLNMIYPQIKPSSGIVSSLSQDSETLKINTVKKSGYYLVYIWAKNPYMQFHAYSAKMSNKKYDTIAGLFNSALSKNSNDIKSKLTVAVNADPSVYYGSYYYCRKNKGCPWNEYTSGGLIIREGTTYRNDTTSNGKRNLTYTVTKDNKMIVLTDKNKFSDNKYRVEAYKPAIVGQARNTFSALHIFMYNGELLSSNNNPYRFSHLYPKGSSASALRNGLCQINDNNFVYFISNTSKTEDTMASVFKKLGCQVAVNNDGGGSTNFWFKKSSSKSWNHVIGSGSRGRMDTIAYWTEL